MSHQDEAHLADRFSADVDRLLVQQDRVEETPTSAEYQALLDVAWRLASLDLSTGHPLHARLRRELLARYRDRQERRPRRGWVGRLRWRAALAGLAAVLLCIGTLAFYPPARTLAQEAWQTVLLGVQLIRDLPQLPDDESTDLTTSIETPAEAVPLVNFPVRVPTYLPEHYEFKYGFVSHGPTQSVFFGYGIPYGRIVLLPNGRAVSGETYKGLDIHQMVAKIPGPWPIGEATVEEVTVGGRPALWLTGLPMTRQRGVWQGIVRTGPDGEIETQVISRQEYPPEVLARTPVAALVWEEGDLLFSVIDLDGRFPLEEMTRIAEGLVPTSMLPPEKLATPTPWPETTSREIASVEEMVAEASFGPYVLNPLPEGWQLDRIAAFDDSDRPLERWYRMSYRHSRGAAIRLTEGPAVPLLSWPNHIESSGTLRHVAANGLEVWTSDMHQWSQGTSIKESARLDGLPVPKEVHAMFLRAPDGFSLELTAVDLSWDETMALIEHLTLAPSADPALNSRLMKGCYPCP
jgi:hypothetical protein